MKYSPILIILEEKKNLIAQNSVHEEEKQALRREIEAWKARVKGLIVIDHLEALLIIQ